MTMTIAETQVCPICQAKNQCAMAVGKSIHGCWCLTQPHSIAAALSRFKSENPQIQFKHKQCICPQCAQAMIDASCEVSDVEIYIP
ncbi:cysteine-rich CWC family protein [Shewanella intestini]|uniref:Cysteine-rich CWC family protein n=1 Tax=Shewanella intestini TaxID=2017544 RepID=A0ABS5I0L7_9GAMM|nr:MULTISPECIES: cysteine-rich CWC family protein [Shewanella]MBR9727573.1 cysteine-rich CWC family protein [Shewanella intestini]MRG35277.1 hypothetical protein [Shewanella sp. XMDDZSB0408]